MNRKQYTTEVWKKKDIRWLAAGMLAIGIFIGVCISCVVLLISQTDFEPAEDLPEYSPAAIAEAVR